MTILLSLANILTRMAGEYPILLKISFGLFALFLVMVVITLLHNAYLIRGERAVERYDQIAQDYLAELVSSTMEETNLRLESKVLFQSQPEIKKSLLFDPNYRTILRSKLKTLHKSLEGSAAKQLRTTYLSLGFLEECVEQLHKGDFVQKADAIKEFTEMEIYSVEQEVKPLLVSVNPELRILAQTFFAKISDTPLSFFIDYPFALSKWDQVELINVLRSRKMDKFPGLRKLFKASNESVRAFAITLTTELQLTSYYSALIPALEDEHSMVRLEAIKQLKKWHHPVALRALQEHKVSAENLREKRLVESAQVHLAKKIFGKRQNEIGFIRKFNS